MNKLQRFIPMLTLFLFIGGLLVPAGQAHATMIYSNTPSDGGPAGSWVASGGMLNADKLPSSGTTASVTGSVNYIDWFIYTWFGSGDMTILCKVNGSTIDSATISRSLLNQTFSGSLPPYGGHSYIYGELVLTSIPWAGSGCNFNAGDTVQLDEWNGSGHNFVAPYDASGNAIGEFGTAPPAPPGDDCIVGTAGTCIDSVTPPADISPTWPNALATSTTFAFGSTGYVSSADFLSGTRITQTVRNNAQDASILAVAYLAFYQTPRVNINYNVPVSSSGAFSFATTTDIQQVGVYTMTTNVQTPIQFFGINTGLYNTKVATTTYFEVATSTVYDALQGNSTASLSNVISAYNAGHNCTDWTQPSQLDACIEHLFIPSLADIQATIGTLHDQILIKAPWGYATRASDVILDTTATTTLPLFQLDVSTMVPGTSGTLDLTPWDNIAGPTSYLATKTIPQTGNHPLTEMLNDWNKFVYIMVGVWFLTRFFGAWQKGAGGPGRDHSGLSLKEEAMLSRSARKRGGWGDGPGGIIH